MTDITTEGVSMIRSVMMIHNELIIKEREISERLDSLTKGKDVDVPYMETFGGLERKINDLSNRGVITSAMQNNLNRYVRSARELTRNQNYSDALYQMTQLEIKILDSDYNEQLAKYMRKPRFTKTRRMVTE